MATYTKQSASLAPTGNVTYVAVAGSDDFANGGQERLHVRNGGGAPINATVNSIKPCDQGSDHDIVVAVPAGGDRFIGPFAPERFTDPATGKATVTYSGTASVTAAVLG